MRKFLYPYFVLLLVLVLGGVTYIHNQFFYTLKNSKRAPVFRDVCPEDNLLYNEESSDVLKIMNGTLSIKDGQFIVFQRNDIRLLASVEQPEHGQIIGLRLTSNGDLFAIGEQRSYKVLLPKSSGQPHLRTIPLPVLYRRPCNRLFQKLEVCQEERAIYSKSISAVFLSGYDSNENLKSYVYGLGKDIIDLSSESSPQYQRDCGHGFVRMLGKSGPVIIDRTGTVKPHKYQERK